ncbi:10375_t:CDS:2 [Funneliformis geosporum]|nr:10375_t:CDS:2 [Funneliformis geosporum]
MRDRHDILQDLAKLDLVDTAKCYLCRISSPGDNIGRVRVCNKCYQYFDQQYPKSCQVIRTEEVGESLEGEELVIEKYSDLESILLKDFSQLKKLTIKNCENLTSLELESDQEIEIILVGQFPLLKRYRIKTKDKAPTNIQHEKGMCLECKIA